jgi:hypothetical protein
MPSFPNRCQHVKVNGTQCGCPALRRNKLCYFHKRHQDERVQLNLDRLKDDRTKDARQRNARRAATLDLPVLEDANSIQVSLMQIMRLIITGQIDAKTAGLLLYALQTASANLGRTSFEPNRHYVVLDLNTVDETGLGEPVWTDSDFAEEEEEDEEAASTQPPAKKPAATKTRAEWQAEIEAKRNATLPIAPFSTRCTPEPAPRDEIRKQLRDQIREAFPDAVRSSENNSSSGG